MPKIHVLSKEMVAKIAAGEVIESPASVVKELLENSLDAGARRIFIHITEGGKGLIRVEDDGCGIGRDDMMLSIQSHATSKISVSDDLFNIHSFGFRGEALASIAEVSELLIRSNTADSLTGSELESRSGVSRVREVSCGKGTIIEVRNLFVNTPARRKYMGSMEAELRQITDVVTRYALGYPEVHFRLTTPERAIIDAPATTDTVGNVAHIYGRDVARQLLLVNFAAKGLEIMGLVGKPSLSRPNRGYESFFVNRRYVKSKVLADAVESAYHSLLADGRYPVAIVGLTISPADIDVNVHPAKREIRLSNDAEVAAAVTAAVGKALHEHDLVPSMPERHSTQSVLITKTLIPKLDRSRPVSPQSYPQEFSEQAALREARDTVDTGRLPPLKIIGQLLNTYILAEGGEGLFLVDQHAAEERVNYELYMRHLSTDSVGTQALLDPHVIELEPRVFGTVIENSELLRRLGFVVEEFGQNSIVVRAIPVFFRDQGAQFIMDLIEELEHAKNKISLEKERMLIMRACKASVKAHDALTLPQMAKLLTELSKADQPYTCPHGRPVIIKMTVEELEKRFKRR